MMSLYAAPMHQRMRNRTPVSNLKEYTRTAQARVYEITMVLLI
jgi:hypothetical protein